MGDNLETKESPRKLSEKDFYDMLRSGSHDRDTKSFDNCIDLLYRDYAKAPWRKNVLEKAISVYPPFAFNKFALYKHESWAEEVIKKASENHSSLLAGHYDLVKSFLWAEKLIKRHIKKTPELVVEGYSALKQSEIVWVDAALLTAARNDPMSVLNSKDKFPNIFAKSEDPIFKFLRKVDKKGLNRRVCFFADPLIKGEMTIEEALATFENVDLFWEKIFKISTQTSPYYAESLIKHQLFMENNGRVGEMNKSHNKTEAVRFESVAGKSSSQLYMTMSSVDPDRYYTSTFLGLYQRLVKQLAKEGKDNFSLLKEHNFKGIVFFVTCCVGFGVISDFLSKMSKEESEEVLSSFVTEINKKSGKNHLLRAALVLDVLGSIKDTALRGSLESLIKNNYEKLSENDRVLYSMLASLYKDKAIKEKEWFEKLAGDNKPLDVSKLSNADLFNEAGQNVQVHLFYDDSLNNQGRPDEWDGHNSFKHFLAKYGIKANYDQKTGEFFPMKAKESAGFKFEDRGSFIRLASKDQKSKKEIVIYANKPNRETEGVENITNLLHSNNQVPHIIVQRGHSYHIKKAIEYPLIAEAKLFFVGGCGGFTNVVKISKKTNAQIIATKQTGRMAINDELLKSINDYILAGKDINWDNFWREKKQLTKVYTDFDAYVPPNKNNVSLLTRMHEAYKKSMRFRLTGQIASTLLK